MKRPQLLQQREIESNRYVRVYMDRLRFPDGTEGTHLRVTESTGAAILVVDEQGRLYLHHAYHYAADREFLEIIRGFGEGAEDAKTTALRELNEEAGFTYEVSQDPVSLGTTFPNSTLLAAGVPLFLVKVCVIGERMPKDTSESIGAGGWFSPREVKELVVEGDIVDGFTLTALALAWARKDMKLT